MIETWHVCVSSWQPSRRHSDYDGISGQRNPVSEVLTGSGS
jgi:hypothetical protein